MWEQLWILSLTVPKWMICLYHTNLSHEVLLSFVWLKFSSFGWDVDMRRIRSDKNLRLGIPKEPQGNIQGISKQLSLGMPRKASPLSSSSNGNLLYFYSPHDMCFAWSVILFSLALLAVWIKYQDLKFLNVKESSHSCIIIRLLIDLHLYISE